MATEISENKNKLKEITKNIDKKNSQLNSLSTQVTGLSKELEALGRNKLKIEKIIEDELREEKEKNDIITSVKESGKLDDFIKFFEDQKLKIEEKTFENSEKIISEEDQKNEKLHKDFDEMEKKYNNLIKSLNSAKENINDLQSERDSANKELKSIPFKIQNLRQRLINYRNQAGNNINKKEFLTAAFYLLEMRDVFKSINQLVESTDQIDERLKNIKLKEAQKKLDDLNSKSSEMLKEYNDKKNGLSIAVNARENSILRNILDEQKKSKK